jgi:hypothetical protein
MRDFETLEKTHRDYSESTKRYVALGTAAPPPRF